MNLPVPIPSIARSALLAAVAALAVQAALPQALAAERPAVNAETVSGAYLAAKAAQAGGALDVAADYFEKALELDRTSQVLRQEAMFAFFAEGRFEDGIELARDLASDIDAGKVARIALGLDAIRQGEAEEALDRLDITDTSEFDSLLVGHLSAWAEADAGRFDDALARIDETTGPAWFPIFNLYQKGLIASLEGDDAEARRVLAALIADPASVQSSPDAYLAGVEALARIEARAGDVEAAIATLDRGLELAPTYDPLVHLRARLQIGDGTPVEAPIANARDGAAEALYTLGQAINRGDGQDVALIYFQFADAVSQTSSPKLLTALAGAAERSSRIDRAIDFYEQIPEDSAFRRTADLQMGLDLWYADRKAEAREKLAKAVEAYPDDLQTHLAYADVLSADKEYEEAARILDRALEIAPEGGANNWSIYYQLGIAHERMKRWDEAEPNFRRALELSPDQPQVLNYLGYSLVDMNRNLDEGLDMIRTAVDLRPNEGYIIDSLGWAYYRLERFDEAVEQLERAILISPTDPTINDHLGDAYWRVGREREARFQWERALNATPAPEPEAAAKIRVKLEEGLGPVGSDVAHEEEAPQERASNASSADEPAALPN